MENSCLFIRGQVWYWEDPIYGRKENKLEVSIGEAVLRYSRYCVIAQTTNTIDKSSVLVIPCSSSNHTPHDVPAPLAHIFHDNFTYARTRGIFPVHPKFLQRYICTLPENIMKQIEVELIKLLLPSVHENMSEDDIQNIFGLDMSALITSDVIPKHEPILEINVRSFIKDHLVKSDPSDSISAYEMKDAFNQYCVIHRMPFIDDIVEFLDIFTKVTNNTGYHFSEKPRFNLVEFKGLKIRGNLKLSIMMNDRDIINPNDPQKPGRWNDETIDEFLMIYNKDGVDAASEKFNLKPSTASNYWYRWKDKLDKRESPSVTLRLPTTVDAPKSVSKMANIIRDGLREECIYEKMDGYEISTSECMTEASFYSCLGTCIYYSLLDFLGIRKDKVGNFFSPNLNENSKYLETWYFFDRVYHDRNVSLYKNGLTLMEAYRNHFPNQSGINSEWLNKLKFRIGNKLNINADGIDLICSNIKKLYCD